MQKMDVDNVMVSVRVNERMVKKLMALGVDYLFRSKAEQQKITQLYEDNANGKKDVYRLNRVDKAGNRQADSGNLLFTKEGQEIVRPDTIIPDLGKFGFGLIVLEVMQKEGDEGAGFLRMTFNKNGKLSLTESQAQLITTITERPYRKCYGYFNAKALSLAGDKSPVQGSITTLNLLHPITDRKELDGLIIRDLRMVDEVGHIWCVPRGD